MEPLRILHVGSEVAPYAKVGGLADVLAVLPSQLNRLGMDARVIMPLYKQIRDKYWSSLEFVRHGYVKMGWRDQYSGLYKMVVDGVTMYFIDNEYYFYHEKIYLEYTFDIERFSFFQRAVLEVLGMPMGFQPDVIHCNDWQSGLIPALLQAHYKPSGYHRDVKTVFTIHNLEYQGIHGADYVADLCDLSAEYMNQYGILHDGVANFMKGGIVYANAVTTVSPTYSQEILTVFYGEGLETVLQNFSFKLSGILNGLDLERYNPETDIRIKTRYNFENFKAGKRENKLALQEELGLSPRADVPLLAMISRLVDQKGLDLLLHILDEFLEEDVQLVVLGTGEKQYEDRLAAIAARHAENMVAAIRFDGDLSHRIYAGSDIFLMPSIFEPCGLSQMISMRYGTIPVVRETGGLKDTVIPYNQYTGEGDGFSFTNINAHEFLFTVKAACTMWRENDQVWQGLVKAAMTKDFSWEQSAQTYVELFAKLVNQRPAPKRDKTLSAVQQGSMMTNEADASPAEKPDPLRPVTKGKRSGKSPADKI